MTTEQFKILWASYPGTIPIPHYFKYHFTDRWFRIHSLPESKRYAENEQEWSILLDRQNKITTDLLGDNSSFLLVTGEYTFDGYAELQSREEASSLAGIHFVSLEKINLNKLYPEEYDPGQSYKPMVSEQVWCSSKFDKLLEGIALDNISAFFISVKNNCIVAPYDGGVDIILKDAKTKNIYKEKYKEWLSARQDGL